ncbi:MAG: hypothetical protein KKE93_01095 [Nanoarchaeota archaeon]|nr:hypothetical protein [Nanoarchaeota archaeon]
MESKKGVISVQFNWVFILIAGVLILLFFGSLVLNLKKNSDITIADTIITNMQTIMTGAEVSVRTINPITIPDKEIKFSCDSISIGDIRKDITKNKIVFAPEVIKGRTLLAWALDWNTPYHVTNFLYLTTPNIKYVFIKPLDQEAEELFDLLPDKINKKKEDLSDIKDTGNYFKLVFFDYSNPQVPPHLNSVSNNKVSAINIISGTNEIEFYKKKGAQFEPVGKANYLGNPMILGAMFSGNLEDYECNVEKAFNKLGIVSMVYEKRTDYLRDLYAGSSCISYYDPSLFSEIAEISKEKITVNSIQLIKGLINNIELKNENLQSYSCPTMY